MVTGTERGRELKQRRHRKRKLVKLKAKVAKAKPSQIEEIKEKIRKLTSGAEQIFINWGIADK